MPSLQDIMTTCHKWAPPETAAAWDNVGLQIGDPNAEISSILLSLDVDVATLKQLETTDYDLIITHHPIFFNSIKSLDYTSEAGKITQKLVSSNTSVFTMHTNLDAAPDGVSDALISHYNMDASAATPISDDNIGRLIHLNSAISTTDLAKKHACRVVGKKDATSFDQIAFCGGSGRSLLSTLAKKKIPAFVTGELNYHDEVFCEFAGITAFLMGHKESETPILPVIKNRLLDVFPNLKIEVVT